MKKFLSLVLAAMMLLSCTVAFAAGETFEVRETDDKWTGTDVASINTPETELWLQVDADGQIDVTVPLVLVFKTNIDGGSANTAETYKLTNNSTADLVVTSIATAVEDKSASNPMTMVAYSATPTEDQYKAQLSVGSGVALGSKNESAWDLRTATHSNPALDGGLFELKKATPNGAGTPTVVKADMTTGKLSFVTSRTEADVLDTTKGVKLLTVTYTVAIDTSDAIGSLITDNGDNTVNGQD